MKKLLLIALLLTGCAVKTEAPTQYKNVGELINDMGLLDDCSDTDSRRPSCGDLS